MKYPIEITGKILAIAPQLYVHDADGRLVLYVKQKLLAFREKVNLFSDEGMKQLAVTIKADRILDFSANYVIEDAQGLVLGNLRRKGMRSLWRASYEITQGGKVIASIHERNPWIKVFDSLIGNVPVLGVLTGLFLNPSYRLNSDAGQEMLRIVKRVSLFERKFSIQKIATDEQNETLLIASILMMVLLENDRG